MPYSASSISRTGRVLDRDANDRVSTCSTSRFERAIARVLVVALIGMTPSGAFAGEEFSDADHVILETPGTIDNRITGQTTIDSGSESGLARWTTGLDQPADNTLQILQPSDTSTFTNQVDGRFGAHLDGTLISNGNVVIASPFGVFFGSEAVLDVGSLVAIGASLAPTDFSNAPVLDVDLTGRVENHGTITADRNVLFYGSHAANYGTISAGTGQILMLGGDSVHFRNDHPDTFGNDVDSVVSRLLEPLEVVALLGSGTVENHGSLRSRDAKLIGSHVANYGEIEVADGSLMMLGADAVYVRQFDNPVLVRLPHAHETNGSETSASDDPRYAVENHGQIRAGLGHVRLAASDPLGWGIRQGSGSAARTARIEAQTIEIAGGDQGRVALSGEIDASAQEPGEIGGEIDITGDVITLADAHVSASGDAGGGTIQIGGEQQGSGELQRASALLMDEQSEVRADALRDGEGGRVILFSEELTLVAGDLSARGGEEGGDGGFIETSGLRHFNITRTPDASAKAGLGGEWLIDPYTINIVDASLPRDCAGLAGACLNRAIEAVLSPNFDGAAFDGIFRTVAPSLGIANPNDLSVDLLVRALAVGTNVTLSTQAFNPDSTTTEPTELDATGASVSGDINVNADIVIRDDDTNPLLQDTLQGTNATLTLRAAGDINVNADIKVREDASPDTSDFALSLILRANDQSQRDPTTPFGLDQLVGDVNIAGDINTGGGSIAASGIAVKQAITSNIQTDGGSVNFTSGSLGRTDLSGNFLRRNSNPVNPDPSLLAGAPTSFDPGVTVAGNIDTSTPEDDGTAGGAITLGGHGIGVRTSKAGDDPLQIDTGELLVTGDLTSGGGNILLSAGFAGAAGNISAGNIEVRGSTISSDGGDVEIRAIRQDVLAENGRFDLSFIDDTRGEGGQVEIGTDTSTGPPERTSITTSGGTLIVGSASAQNISIDGTLSTLGGDPTSGALTGENGLLVVLAGDARGVDLGDSRFGRSVVEIGANDATSLSSAGLLIEARDIIMSSPGGSNAVDLTATGESRAVIDAAGFRENTGVANNTVVSLVDVGKVTLSGGRQITFNPNTAIEGRTIEINAAALPTLLNAEETNGVGQVFAAESTTTTLTRLTFGGTGGQNAANGVRLRADDIQIEIGDGATVTNNLAFEAIVDGTTITPFGFQRGSRGEYAGLQLRDRSGVDRPETISIRQDGDLTISDGVAPTATEIFFGERSDAGNTTGVFGAARVGENGQRITLESSDGVLEVQEADGLNSDVLVVPGADGGRSWVTLNGGLLLPDDAISTEPSGESLLFSGAFVGDSAFDVEGLTVSTPRNLTVTTAIADAIASVADLEFQAGRLTGNDDEARDGTLTIEAGVQLQATNRIRLHGGANGFGDLDFEAGGGTQLATNEIELRAGAGPATQNSSSTDRSEILGIAGVEFQNADGASFQSRDDTELRFSFRQDAAVDSDVDLPTFDQFGVTSPLALSFNAPGAVAPVSYSVRSDFGAIDFTGDALGGARFTDASLSLVGLRTSTAAILIDEGFSFTSPIIELGGVGNFTYTQLLANAFNPADGPGTRLTLRAAMNGTGTLRFESGVVVKAAQINLVASEGSGGTGTGRVAVSGASFDLSEAAAGERTFVLQVDENLQPNDLPSTSQFVGGLLPNVLALRNDNGVIDIRNLDITALPLDLSTNARLILESATIRLSQTNGKDLELTRSSDPANNELANLKLRLRTNALGLRAVTSSTSDAGRVLIGHRTGDASDGATPLVGDDSSFDNESLLIEAFDPTSDVATTSNLSALSAEESDPTLFNLGTGRGPTIFELTQDGAIDPSELPQQHAVSGGFARSASDDSNSGDIATNYLLNSQSGSITVSPSTVSGSNLTIGTTAVLTPFVHDIIFNGDASGRIYDLANLSARTTGSIFVRGETRIRSSDSIILVAAEFARQPTTAFDADNPMGVLDFEANMGDIELTADQIFLSAAPLIRLTNRDGTNGDPRDGVRDPIGDDVLSFINFAGLTSVTSSETIDSNSSTFSATQAKSFDLSDAELNGEGDVIRALMANALGREWNSITLASTQGLLTVDEIASLGQLTRGLSLGRAALDASLVILSELETPFGDSDPMGRAGFEDRVRIESNDVLFRAVGGATNLILDSPNMRLASSTFVTGLATRNELGRLLSDPDVLERASVQIKQPGDFSNVRLPRRDRYVRIAGAREVVPGADVARDDLASIDLVLTTTGTEFVLGESVREGATGSNLTVRAPGGENILIDLPNPTPGFGGPYEFAAQDIDGSDFAALQLNSLDIGAIDTVGGPVTITVGPVLGAAGDELTLATVGDQRFDGRTILEETLSTRGRDIRFTERVHSESVSTNLHGLVIESRGQVLFEGELGAFSDDGDANEANERLSELVVLFDSDVTSGTPAVQFGQRTDPDGDGIFEMAEASDQRVLVDGNIVFATANLNEADDTTSTDDLDLVAKLRADLETATDLEEIATALDKSDIGRVRTAPFATIGKSSGDLSFQTFGGGHFIMGSGERLADGGNLSIDVGTGVASLGDVAALSVVVNASEIGLVRRNAGVTFDVSGATSQDRGSSILANTIDFGGVTPDVIGLGKNPRFGLQSPGDPNAPAFLDAFSVFANRPNGGALDPRFFSFAGAGALAERVPSPLPRGASRSELTGAFGPEVVPTPRSEIRDAAVLTRADRLRELAVEAVDTPNEVRLARLEGVAIIDDLARSGDDEVFVTATRLDAKDAEAAIALYETLFGSQGERAGEVRETLQVALDSYLETTRARRVIGFELRRFVKNRPSTLLKAYSTLDSLDALFRYHRRLGLSPGEFRRIQRGWLAEIQPDGISLEELSEAIHPSRYVRGSDILDIFGR